MSHGSFKVIIPNLFDVSSNSSTKGQVETCCRINSFFDVVLGLFNIANVHSAYCAKSNTLLMVTHSIVTDTRYMFKHGSAEGFNVTVLFSAYRKNIRKVDISSKKA